MRHRRPRRLFTIRGLMLSFVVLAVLLALVRRGTGHPFEATTWLKVSLPVGATTGATRPREPLTPGAMDAHLRELASANVLRDALADPRVAAIPRIRGAADPLAELRRSVRLAVAPQTNLILVNASG